MDVEDPSAQPTEIFMTVRSSTPATREIRLHLTRPRTLWVGGAVRIMVPTMEDKTDKTRDTPTMTYSPNQHMHMHIRTKAA